MAEGNVSQYATNSTLTDEDIKNAIPGLIKNRLLTSLNSRDVLKLLEAKFHVDLNGKQQLIDYLVMNYLRTETVTNAAASDKNKPGRVRKRKSTGDNKPPKVYKLNTELKNFLGKGELMNASEITKVFLQIATERGLRDPVQKSFYNCDQQLQHFLGKDRVCQVATTSYLKKNGFITEMNV